VKASVTGSLSGSNHYPGEWKVSEVRAEEQDRRVRRIGLDVDRRVQQLAAVDRWLSR